MNIHVITYGSKTTDSIMNMQNEYPQPALAVPDND